MSDIAELTSPRCDQQWKDALLAAYQLNLAYGRLLARDIAAEQMCAQPHAGMNHPAWVFGHLTMAGHSALRVLGHDEPAPEGWAALFKRGSLPCGDAAYPSKDELLAAWERTHERVAMELPDVDEAVLTPANDVIMQELLPTRADLLAHLMTTHESIHLGQLSAWRRALGMPGVL